jgi:hypothetical protein
MQFADRARVDLIVATPELDGVTPALASSSTLFIEKTPEQDVYVSDYQWQRPGLQADLFSEPVKPGEMDLVLGVRPVEASARSKARAPVEPAAVADAEISRRETSDPEDDWGRSCSTRRQRCDGFRRNCDSRQMRSPRIIASRDDTPLSLRGGARRGRTASFSRCSWPQARRRSDSET